MALHDGHRQRLKNRFRAEGLDQFDEVQVLELLLFYAVPRRDTNPLAHELLDRFGTLAQVMETPAEELEKVVGSAASTLISLVTAVTRYYMVSRSSQATILSSTEECGEYLLSRFLGRRNETVFVLCLDAKCKVLGCREMGEGSVNSASVPIRRIVETALSLNATSVVLAHNHPSGLAIPSADDVQTTRRLAVALDAVDILLADHIVVADDEFVSLVQSGLYQPGSSYTVL